MILDPVPPDAWAAEGARVAGALDDVAAAVVVGREPAAAFLVALAIARSQRDGRRVAIGDLVGGLAPLTIHAGAPGLFECFRDGLPVSDIARPLTEDGDVYALPSGSGEVAERWVMESARWERLVAGFREVDALLLLVAPPGAPGLLTLTRQVDGVVAVDLPPTVTRAWPLLATVDRPEDELPPIPGTPPGAGPAVAAPRRRSRARLVATLMAVAAFVAIGMFAWRRDRAVAGADAPEDLARSAAPSAEQAPVVVDTITLDPVVNPGDSSRAANFAVELVAANTPESANSRLELRGAQVPAPTIAPVLLGPDGRPWFRALAGAWRERAEADAYLDALRDRGLVRQEVGRVLRAPYALVLAEGIRREEASGAVASWTARGIPAYALLQDDGSVRVFAGAFETSGQAVLLAKSLRDLGERPRLAFRTGRTF